MWRKASSIVDPRRRRRRLGTLALTLFLALRCEPARADERTVVLLEPKTATATSDETLTRARAELTAAGFRVVVAKRDQEDIRGALTIALRDASGIAAIAIDGSASSSLVDVWVTDRLTGKLSIRPVETAGAKDTPSLLAIRAVELLRASLIEIENPPAGAAKPLGVSPVVERFTAPSDGARESARAGFSLEVFGAGLLTMDPATPAIAPGVRLAYVSPFGLGGRLTWMGPSLGFDLEGDLGNAELTQALGLAEAIFVPPVDAPVNVLFSTGLGVYYVSASGDLREPERERTGDSAAFMATFGVGMGVPIVERIALSFEGFIGLSIPRITIDMGEERVGSVGRPIAGTTIGALVGF